MLVALTLALSTVVAPQAMTLRYAPPAGEVATFAYTLSYTAPNPDLDRTNLNDSILRPAGANSGAPAGADTPIRVTAETPLRWQVAERATGQGANALVTRFVTFANVPVPVSPADAASPRGGAAFERSVQTHIGGLAGKTFRYLHSPTGSLLPRRVGKYENAPDDAIAPVLTLPTAAVTPGFSWTAKLGNDKVAPETRATIRDVRSLPDGDRAVVVDLNPATMSGTTGTKSVAQNAVVPGSYAVLSARDGRYLLAHLVVRTGAMGTAKPVEARLDIQRVNGPDLARLKTEMGFDR